MKTKLMLPPLTGSLLEFTENCFQLFAIKETIVLKSIGEFFNKRGEKMLFL